MLTFDDGYTDNYTNLLPLMRQYGYRGVLYLLGDFELRHNAQDLAANPAEPRAELMSEAQKRAFVEAGWEIGAHTQTHPAPGRPTPRRSRGRNQPEQSRIGTAIRN
ncbi:MAG: polysaccharide deacetylase family protein [Hymenobacter sp.]